MQHRKRHVDCRKLAHPRHLGQVVVGERDLEIDREHAVDEALRIGGAVHVPQVADRSAASTVARNSAVNTFAGPRRSRRL